MKLLIKHKRNGYIQEIDEDPPLYGNEPCGFKSYPINKNKTSYDWGTSFEIINYDREENRTT